jgi:N-methylhydantoinase B
LQQDKGHVSGTAARESVVRRDQKWTQSDVDVNVKQERNMSTAESTVAARQSAASSTRVDPITASTIQGALDNIAIEMGFKLMRMAYSSIIRESEDFGAALCDVEGRQLCECAMSTPLQSGPIPGYVRGIIALLKEREQTVAPGDVIIHNDSYRGASHSPDIAFCVPVFRGEQLVGFSVTTAHHLDIGSANPGTCGNTECVDIFAEGLQFRALKVYDRGVRNDVVWQLIRDNVRVPDLVVGDMEAQIAACHVGATRYLELLDRFGSATFALAVEDLFDSAERQMRAQIAKIPDGTYSAKGCVDGFLGKPDPALHMLPLAVSVIVKGSELTVDLTGTAAQLNNYSVNMPLVGTVDVAIWLTLRSILLDSEIHGKVPQNHGLYRPIKITAPLGTLVNPTFPAPTMARATGGNMLADTLMRALAPVLPEQVSAGVANVKAVVFTGVDATQPWVHIEIYEGSYGGRAGLDGLDSVDTLYANTRNNPVEDIESHVPLRVLRYELRESDTCAPGQWRGGCNSIKEVELLSAGFIAVEGDGHAHASWGFDGGCDGALAKTLLTRASGDRVELPSMLNAIPVARGDRIAVVGGTGGGYGPPTARDPDCVRADVLDGLVSREQAEGAYGVVLSDDLRIDRAATERRRAGMPAAAHGQT